MGEAVERLAERLNGVSTVGVDTMVFIYHIENHPRYAPLTRWLLGAVESGALRAVTGVVTLIEVLAKPLQEHREAAAADYQAILTSFPHLDILPVDVAVARSAATLRARLRLRVPDALQLAAAQLGGAEAWITNDRAFRGAEAPPAVLLDDFLPPDRGDLRGSGPQRTGPGEG